MTFTNEFLSDNYEVASVVSRPMVATGRWGNPADLASTETRWVRVGDANITVVVREYPAHNGGRFVGNRPASREVEVRSNYAGFTHPRD